jgi:ParB family chromosome partitioning protein
VALGTLGDRRALEDLEPLLDPDAEISPEDRILAPAAVGALGAMLAKLQDPGSGRDRIPNLDPDERDRVRATVERSALQGPQDIRLGAISGLSHAGDDRSRALLEKLARERLEPEVIRVRAADQLGALGNAGAEEVLAGLLSDASANVRSAAYKALERVFPTERTRTALLALRSVHTELSSPAASFLANHGDSEVLVGRMTEIADDSVRQRLRRGLIRRGECPSSLADLLTGDAAAQRADAAWIAGAAGPDAKPKLGAALAQAVSSSAKQWHRLAGQASRADAARAWRASLWAARRLGVDVQAAALAVVDGSAGGEHEVPIEVRTEALRYLGEMGAHADAAALAKLEPALSHRDAAVRAAAGAAVAQLGSDTATQIIDRLTVADQVAVAPLVAAALNAGHGQALFETPARRRLSLPAMLGDARFEILTAAAQASGKEPTRMIAIASLGRLGSARATAVLQGLLDRQGEHEDVRKLAFKALRRAQRGKTTTATRGAAPQ